MKPEDVQNHQQGQRMPMIHIALMLNVRGVSSIFILLVHFCSFILYSGSTQIPPPFSRGLWGGGGGHFFQTPQKLKSSVKTYYDLSGHGAPRYHPTIKHYFWNILEYFISKIMFSNVVVLKF